MKIEAGKTAFITGGASGIGRGIAHACAARGMNVVLADIEAEALEAAVDGLQRSGARAEGVVVDVADRSAVDAAAAATIEHFGKVHLVCNNAGVVVADPLGSIAQRDWDWIVDVNLKSVIYGVEAFLPLIRAHGEGGHFVNTASVAGLVAFPGFSPYSATKFAVVAMSESWELQFAADDIGVSVLCPGAIATNIFGSRRNQQTRYGGEGQGARGTASEQANIANGLSPEILGDYVLDCVAARELYIVTHDDFVPIVEMGLEARRAGFEATRRSKALAGQPETALPAFF